MDPFTFEHNFCKYCPILIIHSLLQTEIICPCNVFDVIVSPSSVHCYLRTNT